MNILFEMVPLGTKGCCLASLRYGEIKLIAEIHAAGILVLIANIAGAKQR